MWKNSAYSKPQYLIYQTVNYRSDQFPEKEPVLCLPIKHAYMQHGFWCFHGKIPSYHVHPTLTKPSWLRSPVCYYCTSAARSVGRPSVRMLHSASVDRCSLNQCLWSQSFQRQTRTASPQNSWHWDESTASHFPCSNPGRIPFSIQIDSQSSCFAFSSV